MALLDRQRWLRLSPLLDQALELDPPTREAWLGGLTAQDAADLRELLHERDVLDRSRFLEDGPPAGPRGLAGERVGAYTLESLLGEGGMGAVWLARRSDGRFEGRAAVKLLSLAFGGRAGLARFAREGQILARLRHPHIAQLIDAGLTPAGQPYLVLEHVDGEPIDRHCERRRLDLRARIALFLDVLRAVAHAHANLVLHRDLKPSNVLVDAAGQVKLLDFGIAKLLGDGTTPAAATELTELAGRAFTPEFAAPEQVQGLPVMTATDVYAAGVILYRLLTGRHPTPGVYGSPIDRLRAVVEDIPQPASAAAADRSRPAAAAGDVVPPAEAARRRRELRGDLDNILAKALKKAPEERYPGAGELAADLRRYLDRQPVAARPDTLRYRVGKFVLRHRAAVAAAGLAASALASVTLIALSQMTEARRQRDEAREQTQRADAFNTVVTSLLSQVGPGGRALSPEELLDRAVVEVESRYAAQPDFLIDMLLRISGRYFDLRNTNKELATLVKAETIARRTGSARQVVRVQCNTVETELSAGRKAEATQRMEEVRRLLPSLPDLPASLRSDCHRSEGELARASNDMPGAIRHLEQARRLLEEDDRTEGNGYPGILSTLATCQTQAGNPREAHAYTLQIVELDARLGRRDSMPGVISRASLAHSFYNLGDVRQARALFEEMEGVSDREDARPPTTTIQYRYAETLSRLGNHAPALRMIRAAMAEADRGGNHRYVAGSRLTLARSLLRAGHADAAEGPLDEAVSTMMRDEAANVGALAEAGRVRAEIRLAQRRLPEAAEMVSASLRRHGYPPRTSPGAAQALLTQARIELARARPDAALEAARGAAGIFERIALDPDRSADHGESMLVLAQAQAALGDDSAARTSLVRAGAVLRDNLGGEHPLARQARDLAVR
jgi:serine/threonine protein kinase